MTNYVPINNTILRDIVRCFNPGTPYGTYMSHVFFLHLLHEYNKKIMQFILSLSRILQFYSINFRICGIVELWGISTKLRYLLKVSSD